MNGRPDLAQINAVVSRFHRTIVDDRRNKPGGGRLWVSDPLQRAQLGTELVGMGFKWSDKRLAWYFPEN